MRVLLVEDDSALAQALCGYLRAKAYTVDAVTTIAAAKGHLASAAYAVVLIDLHLPDGDGLALMPTLRALAQTPVAIVLTARDQVSDRIRGLDAGADDYLVKPYDPEELLARLRAVNRRRAAAPGAALRLAGGIEIDLAREMVRSAGVPLVLTPKEWALLRVLAARPEWLHTRESLLDALYGFDSEADSNTLEVFISRLRRKLGRDAIQTQRGLGYRLMAEGAAPP